jgi:hypothetical protein
VKSDFKEGLRKSRGKPSSYFGGKMGVNYSTYEATDIQLSKIGYLSHLEVVSVQAEAGRDPELFSLSFPVI